MKPTPQNKAPVDADARRKNKPVICYPVNTLPMPNMTVYAPHAEPWNLRKKVIVRPRDAKTF